MSYYCDLMVPYLFGPVLVRSALLVELVIVCTSAVAYGGYYLADTPG